MVDAAHEDGVAAIGGEIGADFASRKDADVGIVMVVSSLAQTAEFCLVQFGEIDVSTRPYHLRRIECHLPFARADFRDRLAGFPVHQIMETLVFEIVSAAAPNEAAGKQGNKRDE